MRIELPKEVKRIIDMLHNHGHEAYAVGGAVRDAILGRKPGDWDITTDAFPSEIKSIFKKTVDTGIEHGTVTVLMGGKGYEVTTYRIDGEYYDSRHPSSVEFTGNLREDLLRRDFTINAMAYNDTDGLIDEFGGLDDIKIGIIRCVGNARERFSEDALRMLRAIRFSAQLGFEVDEDTQNAIRELASTIQNISSERIRDELLKTIESDNPRHVIELYNLGLTKYVLPEFDEMIRCEQNSKHHIYNVGEHTVISMENVPPNRVLRLTMLLHDTGKPIKKTMDDKGYNHFYGHPVESARIANNVLRRLKMDNATRKKVVRLVRYHDERPALDEKVIRHKIVEIGIEAFPDIFTVNRADTLAQSEYMREEKLSYINEYEKIYNHIIEEKQALSIRELEITGSDLVKMGLKEGPLIGEVLKELFEDVLNYPQHNSKDYLYKRAEKLIDKYGEE